MHNPLHRRLGRQLLHNAGRHLGIFALLVATISVVSGCLITISSVQAILENMDEKNSVEDALRDLRADRRPCACGRRGRWRHGL